MSKEKVNNLIKYVETMKARLQNIPERRKGNEVYLQWINREIEVHMKKAEELKLYLQDKK